jgi:4-carboxymuconolactone decarboxylase
LERIIGAHDAAALTGGDMQRQLDNLAAIAPTLGRFILELGFGEVVAGATIGFREWNLIVLAGLMALGDAADQSAVYLRAALAHGATEQEVQDVLHLVYLYAGAPRAVTGARRMSDYCESARGLDADRLASALIFFEAEGAESGSVSHSNREDRRRVRFRLLDPGDFRVEERDQTLQFIDLAREPIALLSEKRQYLRRDPLARHDLLDESPDLLERQAQRLREADDTRRLEIGGREHLSCWVSCPKTHRRR